MKFCASAVSAFTLLSAVATTEATFQSPPRGATYAASMVAGPEFIYYTGITYNAITNKPHCFLATSSKDPTDFLEFEIFGGTESTPTGDSCRAVAVLGQQEVAVVGTADPEGYFGFANATETARGLPQIGFGMTLSADSLDPIKGATLSSFARVPYPQAVVGDPNDPNIMYVASMASNQDTYNIPQEEFPNWSRLFQHGTTFALTVEAFYPSDDVVVDAWTKYFPVDTDNTDDVLASVHVGGMINKPGVGLIIAGSTAAQGEGYGPGTGEDEDGFVTILDPATGELHNSDVEGSARTSQRFGSDSFDIVTNICDDPIDENAFYIVGATVGDMNGHIFEDIVLPPTGSLQAFIRKVYASSLQAEWTVQLPAYIDAETITSTEALGCAVNNIGSVFVVGQVENGAGMVERNVIHESKGGRDMWIARIDTETAERKWIQQVGSEGDEHVARSGPIVVDDDGNVIVYGDTNGNIYRDRMVYAQHDLFVIRFDESDGYFAPTLSGDVAGVTKEIVSIEEVPETDPPVEEIPATEPPMEETPEEEQPVEEEPPAEEEPFEEEPPEEEQPFEEDPVDESTFETASSEAVKKEGKSTGGIVGIVLLFLAMVVLALFFTHRRRQYRRKQSSSVYDAAAADLGVGYEFDANTGRGFGIFRAKNSPVIKTFGGTTSSPSTYRDEKDTNLNYRDEPDEETNDLGNFHRTYEPASGPAM